MRDILTAASKQAGVTKTVIVYQANLNFTRLDNYLPLLFEKDLLRQDENNRYFTTDTGRTFLENIKKVFDLI